MRPYFKFTLPAMEINPVEEDLWRQARDEKIDIAVLHEMIEELRSAYNSLEFFSKYILVL